MNGRQLATIAVVSTLLLAGLAGLGAASPAEQASDNAPGADEDVTALPNPDPTTDPTTSVRVAASRRKFPTT